MKTPEEVLEDVTRQLREALETEVLDRLRKGEPKFLEQVVKDLLIAMGYGGGDATMGQVIGRSGDGGINDFFKIFGFAGGLSRVMKSMCNGWITVPDSLTCSGQAS